MRLCPLAAALSTRVGRWRVRSSPNALALLYQRLKIPDKTQPLPDPEDVTTSLHADIERCSKMMIRPQYY